MAQNTDSPPADVPGRLNIAPMARSAADRLRATDRAARLVRSLPAPYSHANRAPKATAANSVATNSKAAGPRGADNAPATRRQHSTIAAASSTAAVAANRTSPVARRARSRARLPSSRAFTMRR